MTLNRLKLKNTTILYVFILIRTSLVMGQELDYYPPQRDSVSDSNYEYGIFILEETYKDLKKSKGIIKFGNYWNLGIAYKVLREDPEKVKKMVYESKKLNPNTFSYMFSDVDVKKQFWENVFTDIEYDRLYNFSINQLKKSNIKSLELENSYIDSISLYNKRLINIIKEIKKRDSKYRFSGNLNMSKQKNLDKKNLAIIDSLYAKHNKYIGRSLVGEKYMNVMWAVIQHSDIESMEKYLPIIHIAVQNGGLEEGALKLLLDRIYTIKGGEQIFGSQRGIPFMSKDKSKLIVDKYMNVKVKKKLHDWLKKKYD